MVIISILISQLGSWQLREDKVRSEEITKPGFKFSSAYSKVPTIVSDPAASLQFSPRHPQDSSFLLRKAGPGWVSQWLRGGEADGPFTRGHQWRPCGPRPTRTGFCWESGRTQSTNIYNVVSLRKGNYQVCCQCPFSRCPFCSHRSPRGNRQCCTWDLGSSLAHSHWWPVGKYSFHVGQEGGAERQKTEK